MKLEWLDAIERVEADTTFGFEGIPNQPLRAKPSERTIYCVYLQPDDTYLTVVTIYARSGPVSITYNLGQELASEEVAKMLAQADWDKGQRP